jgi:hypothetical protein
MRPVGPGSVDEMDRYMRKALLSRARYDWDTHEATRKRNAEQMRSIPTPQFPATGTARISALLATARRRRDEALIRGAGDGAGLGTSTPLDNVIEPATQVRANTKSTAPVVTR